MDDITKTIIKLVNIRYPHVRVITSAEGRLSIESYYPNKGALGQKQPEVDASEEHEYLISAKDYMVGLQHLAISQPGDLARLDAAIQSEIREAIGLLWRQGREEAQQLLQCNRPYVMADAKVYECWADLGSWHLDDAVLLLLGRNPDMVSSDMLEEQIEITLDGETSYIESDFARDYHQLRRVVHSHTGDRAGPLLDPVQPRAFLEWARQHKRAIPPDLTLAMAQYPETPADRQDRGREDVAESAHLREARGSNAIREEVPKQRRKAQEDAILEWLKNNGYDPMRLPKWRSNAPGVKADVKAAMLQNTKLFSEKSFELAWERLSSAKEIQYAK